MKELLKRTATLILVTKNPMKTCNENWISIYIDTYRSGWARDGFFCNCFYRIRLNTRKWFILTNNRMFEIIKVSTIWQF